MDVLLVGTGGEAGWPQDGCRCASCMRARVAGRHREPGEVRVDDTLTFRGTSPPPAGRHVVRPLPGGWDVTAPDGARMLLAAGQGAVPEPLAGAQPYDVALLDLLAGPAQLGRFRSAGLVRSGTAVLALCTDHRVSSEREMTRRCEIWRAVAGEDGQLVRIRRTEPPPGSGASAVGGERPGGGPVRPHRTLIIGGARSGKSAEAQLRLSGEPRVTYLAAGPWPEGSAAGQDRDADRDWASRVAAHRAARPPWWRTLETLDVAAALRTETGAILVDGIGTWLAGVMASAGVWEDDTGLELVEARIAELIEAWRQTSALVVAVTDQVGSGVVPAFQSGRLFRDQLGWLNQRLAAESEVNLLVVAGRVTTLPA